jgi:uncharacterized membrane protein YedE/YeeE
VKGADRAALRSINHPEGNQSMKKTVVASSVAVILIFGAGQALAAGCLKGAAVGALAGHVAGHHAVVGAIAGCAIGHHVAKDKAKKAAQDSATAQVH